MSCNNYTSLKYVENPYQKLFMNELEDNLKTFFDWGLLGAGYWQDVSIPQSGQYGNQHILKPVSDQSYTDGQVWQAFRHDWVWETGVEYDDTGNNPEPSQVTGVKVDGTFYGSGDATYGWHINYPLGRVVFDSAIDTGSNVQVEYSYRTFQTVVANNAPWFREIQFRSFRPDEHFQQIGSGDWAVGNQHRIQLPTIIIESAPRAVGVGYELGNSAQWVYQDVLFHVISEDRYYRNQLLDIIRSQDDKVIWLYNSNDIAQSGAWPLDYRGMVTGSNMYPDLVSSSGYRWKKVKFTNSIISDTITVSPKLYTGIVKTSMEVALGNI